ncbi:thioredoxin [Oribacterium sp. oral taxon 102]|uniref:thioredoxin n=1 Tax=Oribacterium sp. oral taxon 102 TaxID=671214 RepID=UPI0015C00D2E|nr:thioredoxin [Oribacterium sp. oral taxon 102]NWO22292.1 thioredoxin [Oribacterium sp. oral taxon 102]
MAATKLTAAEFDEKVLRSEVPVLVDFWADWCGPCKMLSPIIAEIAGEAKDFKVYAVNADEESELMSRFGIRAIPTLIVFKNGEIYKQNTGFIPKEQVLDLLK